MATAPKKTDDYDALKKELDDVRGELKALAEKKAAEGEGAIEKLKSQIADIQADAKTRAGRVKARAEEGVEEAIDQARGLSETLTDYARENPEKAVVIASGIGFIVGWLISRD